MREILRRIINIDVFIPEYQEILQGTECGSALEMVADISNR
jgi:hypothetical protein